MFTLLNVHALKEECFLQQEAAEWSQARWAGRCHSEVGVREPVPASRLVSSAGTISQRSSFCALGRVYCVTPEIAYHRIFLIRQLGKWWYLHEDRQLSGTDRKRLSCCAAIADKFSRLFNNSVHHAHIQWARQIDLKIYIFFPWHKLCSVQGSLPLDWAGLKSLGWQKAVFVILSSSDPQHSPTQLNSLAGIKARLVSCRAAFCNCFSSW